MLHSQDSHWKSVLHERLPLLGHRNWIVVADAAYPAQASPGVETIVTGAEHLDVVTAVLDGISSCRHIRASAFLDLELGYVSERDAPGVEVIRRQLHAALDGSAGEILPHEEIISRLDAAGRMFRILLMKTKLAIPYTSVFLSLECGYWGDEAEARLRASMMRASMK
jgi:L-fucose mutarotase/ribose pyranase (RbsD/FucU family)